MQNNMNVFVVVCSGFIGARLVRRIISNNKIAVRIIGKAGRRTFPVLGNIS